MSTYLIGNYKNANRTKPKMLGLVITLKSRCREYRFRYDGFNKPELA